MGNMLMPGSHWRSCGVLLALATLATGVLFGPVANAVATGTPDRILTRDTSEFPAQSRAAVAGDPSACSAPSSGPAQSTRYRVLENSYLVRWEDGVGAITPLKGTFDLVTTPAADQFLVKHFRGFDLDGSEQVTGEGSYALNYGEDRMVLDVIINDAPHHLDSGWEPFGLGFPPMLDVDPGEISGASVYYTLHVVGVPALGIWFSTDMPFHSATGPTVQFVSDGDVLTHFGRVLWTNAELTRNLSIMPPVPDIGCDAFAPVELDGVQWWEAWFSAEVGEFSELLGPLKEGDFLSEGGFIVARNEDLVQNFLPLPPPLPDLGLDAITWGWPCQNWYFSTEVDFWAGSMNDWVRQGDMLCAAHGQVYMRNAQLMANFHPAGPPLPDYGLDALYLWPTGQIWFSVEETFWDLNHGWVSDGDLLSTEGWVIYRNLELVRRFEPIEDVANFGLDALHVVPVYTGDMNGDAAVNFRDINPFVLALSNPEMYYLLYPELDPDVVGDINGDGTLNFRDINPFVMLLTRGD